MIRFRIGSIMKLVAQYFGADGLWSHFFARLTLLFVSLRANGVNRIAFGSLDCYLVEWVGINPPRTSF